MNWIHLIGMHLPFSSLRIFEAAVRTGSFRHAAVELGLSPSAVSHGVRKLEDLLGKPLFEREGRSVRVNVSGLALYDRVSGAFDQLRLGIEAVGSRSRNLLRLHCAPSMAAQWLMPRLAGLMADQPDLEVRLSANADYPRFYADEFDADICYGPPRQDTFHAIPLGEEIVTPLCSPVLAERIRNAEDLLELSLIESEHKRVRWRAWFDANGLAPPPPRGSRFDRSFMAIAAAVDGLGVTLESTRLAEREIATGQLVAPLAGRARDVSYVGHWLVFPPRARTRPAVRLFAEWVIHQLGLDPVTTTAPLFRTPAH